MTHQLCHAHLPDGPPNLEKLLSKSLPIIPDVERPLVGPQTVRFDSFSMLRWTLLGHGGYATYPHKDANGLCTWIFAHVGIKVWAIMEPKYVKTEHDTRRTQFKLHKAMMGAPFDWDYEKDSNMYTTFLAPGGMM